MSEVSLVELEHEVSIYKRVRTPNNDPNEPGKFKEKVVEELTDVLKVGDTLVPGSRMYPYIEITEENIEKAANMLSENPFYPYRIRRRDHNQDHGKAQNR